MKIIKKDIEEYIYNLEGEYDEDSIVSSLYSIYEIDIDQNRSNLYVINHLVKDILNYKRKMETIYNDRRDKLNNLKLLEMPEQRSEEWYEMRKKRLTASSLAAAIGKCHFTSRDELILSKIEDKPYESNPITEWGVKYEDVAIMFYEELYNVKILDFGLVPHPDFEAFGASPDGICDDTGNLDYIGRMVEIKCPPKRKFTKTVPEHYKLQVLGQLEVCDLDECDFFQVKVEEYENIEEYINDYFEIENQLIDGRTHLNYPKSVTMTYIDDGKLSYEYAPLNLSIPEIQAWIEDKQKKNMGRVHEVKFWKITRYECTLVKRDKLWWSNIIDSILNFYNDMLHYKTDNNVEILKSRIKDSKTRKKKVEPLEEHQLISDEEDN
mgnify:FL=1